MTSTFLILIAFCAVGASAESEKPIPAPGEETCFGVRMTYEAGMSFVSYKPDGSSYGCRCEGSSCLRLTCYRNSDPVVIASASIPVASTPAPSSTVLTINMSAEVQGEVGGEEEGAIVGVVPGVVVLSTVNATDAARRSDARPGSKCYDQRSGRYYNRGESFLRIDETPRKSCTCPTTGRPVIQCQTRTCQLADAPRAATYPVIPLFGCYDPWNKQVYSNGERYRRTRRMSDTSDLTGVYDCTCYRGMNRCTAVDIPCCDYNTGEFARKGDRFVTSLGGQLLQCTCLGLRQSFQNCIDASGTTTTTATTTTSNAPRTYSNGRPGGYNLYYPRRRPSVESYSPRCYDRTTRRRYRDGETFTQNRGTYTAYCVCQRARSRTSGQEVMRITCQRSPSQAK